MIIFVSNNVQQSIMARKLFVHSDVIFLKQFYSDVGDFNFVRFLGCFSHCEFNAPGPPLPTDDGDDECNTAITKSHKSRAGIPSMRKPAIKDITSNSVELCETAVCFLHIQLSGTKVRLPKMHKTSLDVDLEYSRSPAKSAS